MESSGNPISTEVAYEFQDYFRIYKDGRLERLIPTQKIPPSVDQNTGVSSKDILILPEIGISARLFLPKTNNPNQKFPLLIHYHGGAFVIGTPFSPTYHNYLTSVAAQANVVIISVDYRKAPEYPLPIAYEDSWVALKWVFSHSNRKGIEKWLNDHVDFDSVFLGGESAGANISHNMAIRAGTDEEFSSSGFKISGIVLIHPFFWGIERIGLEGDDKISNEKLEKLWCIVCPLTTGCDDPLINPVSDPNFSRLGCNRVFVFVAEKDVVKERGWFYYESLRKSGWDGVVEIMESKGEGHVFHLYNPRCERAKEMMQLLVSFLNQDKVP